MNYPVGYMFQSSATDPTNPNRRTTNPSLLPQLSFLMLLRRYLPPQDLFILISAHAIEVCCIY